MNGLGNRYSLFCLCISLYMIKICILFLVIFYFIFIWKIVNIIFLLIYLKLCNFGILKFIMIIGLNFLFCLKFYF